MNYFLLYYIICCCFFKSLSAGKIRLQLESINTLARSVCSLTSYLEVKYQSDFAVTGARFVIFNVLFLINNELGFVFYRWCGNTITSPWLNITAETNTMVVIFRASNYINPTSKTAIAGFRASILFGMYF